MTRAQLAAALKSGDHFAVAVYVENLAQLVAALWGTVPGKEATPTIDAVEQFLREWHPGWVEPVIAPDRSDKCRVGGCVRDPRAHGFCAAHERYARRSTP